MPGKVLRVRLIGGKAMLGYKGILNKAKVKENLGIEIEVSDGLKMVEILERLGFRREREIRKKRKSFLLGNVRIDIDDYPGIPRLMEIEGDEEGILGTARLLGIHEHELKPWSLKDVEEHYARR